MQAEFKKRKENQSQNNVPSSALSHWDRYEWAESDYETPGAYRRLVSYLPLFGARRDVSCEQEERDWTERRTKFHSKIREGWQEHCLSVANYALVSVVREWWKSPATIYIQHMHKIRLTYSYILQSQELYTVLFNIKNIYSIQIYKLTTVLYNTSDKNSVTTIQASSVIKKLEIIRVYLL